MKVLGIWNFESFTDFSCFIISLHSDTELLNCHYSSLAYRFSLQICIFRLRMVNLAKIY